MCAAATLRSKEKLKSRKDIETLFRHGKAFSVFPIKLIIIDSKDCEPYRIGFAVSKKNLKLAVQRNVIKRRLREAWRLHKSEWTKHTLFSQPKHLFIIYTGRDHRITFSEIQQSLALVMEKCFQHNHA